MIERKVIADITLTPDELASEFASMGSEQQAMFFNELANLVNRLTPFEFQVRALTNHPALTDAGRLVMQAIGGYAFEPAPCRASILIGGKVRVILPSARHYRATGTVHSFNRDTGLYFVLLDAVGIGYYTASELEPAKDEVRQDGTP